MSKAEPDGSAQPDFSAEFEAVAPALYAWADLRLRSSTRAPLEAADLVQEVGLRAWRGIGDLDREQVPLRAWLFRIAKNVLLEALRQGWRTSSGVGPTTRLGALESAPDPATAVSRRLARDEGLAAFGELVRSLPEDEQRMVILYGLEGLPRGEVAQRLGIGPDALSKRWTRLAERLRERGLAERFLVEGSA